MAPKGGPGGPPPPLIDGLQEGPQGPPGLRKRPQDSSMIAPRGPQGAPKGSQEDLKTPRQKNPNMETRGYLKKSFFSTLFFCSMSPRSPFWSALRASWGATEGPRTPPRSPNPSNTFRQSMMFAFSPFRFRWAFEASGWPQDGPKEPQEGPKMAP